MSPTDVVITGGGPNGLLLACELALGGVRPVLLEREPERNAPPKANGLVGRVVQAMDYRGLYELFTGDSAAPVPLPRFQFGALPLDLTTIADNALYAQPIPQRRLEELLEQRSRELGVEIRRGHEMVALSQDAEGVSVEVRGPDGRYQLTARYLVGADGGHSLVRKESGIEFPGVTDQSFVSRSGRVVVPAPYAVADTGELDVPGAGRFRPATFTRTERGMFAFGMFQPGVYSMSAFEWTDQPLTDDEAMPVTELRDAVRRVLGADVPMSEPADGEPTAFRRRVGTNSRQADRYRRGRVFLVGDAAHVHSGIGGPGLNLGMQDVLNLGWKLAAEINGWAPDGLLDTYQSERHPVGERVIMHTRAQSALLSPGPNNTALRGLFTELLNDPGTTQRVADLMAGSGIHYDMRTGQDHPMVGRWMPDLALRGECGPARVAELLRSGPPVLLDLAGRLDLVGAAKGWADRIDVVTATAVEPPADAVLVRPDGYVAWAAGSADPEAADMLRTALRTWFGESA